jgi:ABC-type phosphate transport system substrate-binding protein
MWQKASGKSARVVGALSLVALSITAFAVAAPSRATDGPRLVVTPPTHLRDGQVVTVSWTGFEPDQIVAVELCATTGHNQDDCARYKIVTSNSDGAGSAVYGISSSEATGHGIPGNATLRCGVGFDCSLFVVTPEQIDAIQNGMKQDLAYSPEPNSCPQTNMTSITGGGSGAVLQTLPDWQVAVCQDPERVTLDYVRSKSDPFGRQDFHCGLADFAVTELPAPADEKCMSTQEKRAYAYAPLANTALVFAYSMYDVNTGQRITNLKLTPEMLTWTLTGQTLTWSGADPSDTKAREINDLNSGHRLPSGIYVTGRADECSLNLLLTRFMLERAPSAMATARSPFDFTEPTAYFPAAPSVNDLKSNADAVALAMSSYDDPTGQTGYLGVMDAATAAFYGLPTVKIENVQKTGFVSANPASIAAGVAAMTTNADGTAIANLAPADPAAYPLPITSFAQVPTSKTTDSKVSAAIKAMLAFVVSPAQQAHLLDGYVPLTDKQKTAIQRAETLVGNEADPTPTPTPTPSNSATPTPTPSDSATPSPSATSNSGSGTDAGNGFGAGADGGSGFGSGTDIGLGTGVDGGTGIDAGTGIDTGGQGNSQNGTGVVASSIFDSTQPQKSSLPGFTLVVFAMGGAIPLGLSAWKSSWRQQS